MSNLLLKILIVVALILAWLVYYSNKIIHEKPIHKEERVVVKSVVMPHPPLSDKSRKEEEENALNEDIESEKSIEKREQNNTTVELIPDIPQEELEIRADEPEIVINDETEIIDDNEEEEIAPVMEEPILTTSDDEVDSREKTPKEEIPIEQPKIDLGTRIGDDEEQQQNVDLGVQLF